MAESRLKFRDKLSRRSAHDVILTIAKYGNHLHSFEFITDADVKRFFQRNKVDFDILVRDCMQPDKKVPFFENLIGSTWEVNGKGNGIASIIRTDSISGKEDVVSQVQGPGKFTFATYWALYEQADKGIRQSVQSESYTELLLALSSGLASVESYVAYRVDEWNRRNPCEMLIDSKEAKVSFDDKFDIWIPKISGGKKLDKSTQDWASFKLLRSIRDNEAIHPKNTAFAVSLNDFADIINKCRTGIAGLLIQLHLIFKDKIPAVIIRGRFAPDVEVIVG